MFEFCKFTCGDPCQPPLIFLHGFLGAKEDWENMFPFFEKRFFCTAYDLPGHGSTPHSEDILSALKNEIQTMFRTKPILIGYSLGGRIALQLQEYASALVALSAHPGLADKKEKEERRKVDRRWSEKLISLPFDVFFAEWYEQPIFHSLRRNLPLLQLLLKRRMKQNPQDLARVLQQLSLANQPNMTQFLIPALFIHGEEDLKYRELYCRLPEKVAVRSIKHSGHAVHLENARACAEEILNWLDF
jgi:2-succinyl-6-hydroxy-2,4-cyclohexadiene-1-carboxylate synthase